MYRQIATILTYAAVTGAIFMIGFLLFILVSIGARDVLLLHMLLKRQTYSTIEALLTLGIYMFSPLIALPLTCRIVNRFPRRTNDTHSNPTAATG